MPEARREKRTSGWPTGNEKSIGRKQEHIEGDFEGLRVIGPKEIKLNWEMV
jgi:hypothetical protein